MVVIGVPAGRRWRSPESSSEPQTGNQNLTQIYTRSSSYLGNLVDGPQNGTSPRPWDIKVQTPPLFQDDTRKFRIPHSSLVKVIPYGAVKNQGQNALLIRILVLRRAFYESNELFMVIKESSKMYFSIRIQLFFIVTSVHTHNVHGFIEF